MFTDSGNAPHTFGVGLFMELKSSPEKNSLSASLIASMCVYKYKCVYVCVCVCDNCFICACDESVTNPSRVRLFKYKVTSPLLNTSLENSRSRSISPHPPPLLPSSPTPCVCWSLSVSCVYQVLHSGKNGEHFHSVEAELSLLANCW